MPGSSSPAPPEMISISNVFNTGCAVKHICNDNPIFFFDHIENGIMIDNYPMQALERSGSKIQAHIFPKCAQCQYLFCNTPILPFRITGREQLIFDIGLEAPACLQALRLSPLQRTVSSFTLLSVSREYLCRVMKIALLHICKAARQFLVKLRLRHLIHVNRVRRLRQRNSERNRP